MLQGYLTEGAWHVRGTSQALSNAYAARIRELGGEVRTGVRVASIQVEKGKVQGVTTEDGTVIQARYVVSNADPYQTFFQLVGRDRTPRDYARRLDRMEIGNSLVGLWLGLDVEPSHWGITDHEVFLNDSLDPEANYQAMMEGRYDHASLAMTFNTNLGDSTYAPPGHSVVNLVGYGDIASWPTDPAAHQAMKARVGDQMLTVAERVLPGLREHVQVMEVMSPRTIQAYTLHKDGVPYGSAFTVDQLLKLPNETPIQGLYLGSSWASPGHGVSTAQLSGYQAARLILDAEGRP